MNASQQQTPTPANAKRQQAAVNIPAFAHIVEQYATDAAFLWLLRSEAVNSTLYNRDDIAELDRRIQGLADGLQACGNEAWMVCQQQLEMEEAGEAFVAAVYAFQSGDAAKIQLVCEKARANTEMLAGLVSAMGWIEPAIAHFWIERFLAVTDADYRYLGLAACSVRRYDPGALLTRLLLDEELVSQPLVYARALRLIGELKRFDLVPALNQGMEMEDAAVKFWSLWSAVLLGNRASIPHLKSFVMQDNPFKERALALVFNLLPVQDARKWISEISSDLDQHRTVISTTAILGDPHAIDWLIQQMQKPLYARVAGLSFSIITGIDLEESGLYQNVDNRLPDTEEDDIVDDAEDIDSDLPWPDPVRIKAFWAQQSHQLNIGQRYFMGQPVESGYLKDILVKGNQLQRNMAALKLALLENEEIFVNTASPGI